MKTIDIDPRREVIEEAAYDLFNALKEFVYPYQSGKLTEGERTEKARAAIIKARQVLKPQRKPEDEG